MPFQSLNYSKTTYARVSNSRGIKALLYLITLAVGNPTKQFDRWAAKGGHDEQSSDSGM